MHYRLFVFEAMQSKNPEQKFSIKYNYESPLTVKNLTRLHSAT